MSRLESENIWENRILWEDFGNCEKFNYIYKKPSKNVERIRYWSKFSDKICISFQFFQEMDLLKNSDPLFVDYLTAIRPHQGFSQGKALTSARDEAYSW